MAQKIANFSDSMRAAVRVDRDMLDIAKTQPRFAQAIGDRLRRKSSPMLDAPKTLFFCRRYQHAVPYQGSRRICVKGVNPEDYHFLKESAGPWSDFY
jgi:hypothetical protein